MAWTSKTTEEFKNGNGSNLDFTFSFEYLQQDDVKVQVLESNVWVDKAETTDWTFHNATTIRFNSGKAPANLTRNVRIYRDTEIDAAKAIYAAGSSVRAKDLNDNQDQLLYALQEEQFNVVIGAKIDQGAITNTNVSPVAEIEVSKLKDGTARQLLQTDTAGTGVEWTSNVDVPGTLDVTGAVDFDSTLTVDGTSTLTGNVTVGGTVDGRDIAADGTKLDGIENGATADQTAAEIKTLVGNATDSNVFTDAEKTKLGTVETNAAADQTAAEIKTLIASSPLDASHLAEDSVGASELADNSVASANIINGSITNDDIAANADIGGAKILQGSISNDKLMPGQITGSELADEVINKVDFIRAGGTPSNNKVLVYDTGEATGWKWDTQSGSGGGSPLTVQEEGSSLSTAATTLNFVGANVTASGTGSTKTITISGGGEVTVQDEGTALSTAATTLNFVGAGVTASGTGATKTITISGSGGGAVTTDFQYLELKAHNNASGAFSAGSADYELVTKGTTTAVDPGQAAALMISIGGVIQEPNTGTSIGSNDGFCVDGSSIHFGANLTAHPEYILWLKGSGSHTIADEQVTLAKLEHGTSSNDGKFLRANNGADPTWETVSSGGISDVVSDTSPQLGGALDVQAQEINTSTTNGNIKLTPNGTGVVEVKGNTNPGTIQLNCENNSHSVKLKGPAHSAAASYTLTLPNDDGDANEVLKTDGSGNLDWVAQTDTTYSAGTGLSLSGTTFSVNTLNQDTTGTAAIATTVTVADESSDTTCFPLFATAATGDLAPKSGSNLTFNSNTGALGATSFTGDGSALTGVSSSVANGCIWENDQTISDNYTIASGKGAHSVGPITVNATVTVNGNWVVS